MQTIPFLNLPEQHRLIKNEILASWSGLLDTAGFIGGAQVELFEEEFAKACQVAHCVSVSNGTDALRLIFQALGVKNGDEIITVPNSFIATTEAISQAGGKIAFVDIDRQTYNIDCKKIEDAISPQTVGIVPIHLYGQTADMDAINDIARRHKLWVVEDSCQAHLAEYKGRRTGSLGHAAAFSFYPGKNLGACGEAGAVTTDDHKLAEKIRILRNHGQSQKYFHEYEGYNNRCDALQAAALRIKLPYLKAWNETRRQKAALYTELLKDTNLTLPFTAQEHLHVFHLFVILAENRDSLAKHLTEHGISTGFHYPLPLHLQKAYSHLGLGKAQFPVTEDVSVQLLSLPMYPELTDENIHYICTVLKGLL